MSKFVTLEMITSPGPLQSVTRSLINVGNINYISETEDDDSVIVHFNGGEKALVMGSFSSLERMLRG